MSTKLVMKFVKLIEINMLTAMMCIFEIYRYNNILSITETQKRVVKPTRYPTISFFQKPNYVRNVF